jgi:CRP-like cAMP-binding protein
VISATHELIAEGTASTRESVSKIITELRSEGLIESGYRSIVLLDTDMLDDIAHGL